MTRDFETRLDEAAVAAGQGATADEIIEECGLDRETAENVVCLASERRKRWEAIRGKL